MDSRLSWGIARKPRGPLAASRLLKDKSQGEKMKKYELKTWLNEDRSNRHFIRRIGIPQWVLINITSTEELQKIKNEFTTICRNNSQFKQIEKIKGRDFARSVLNRMCHSSFWQGYWYNDNHHKSRDLLSTWSYLLKNTLPNNNRPYELRRLVSKFFSNVRTYLRRKKADMIESNTDIVYTVKTNMPCDRVDSKFLTTWSYHHNTVKPGMPMFFLERDYCNRYIFMAGTSYIALSLTDMMKVIKLEEAQTAVSPELKSV